jgi:hypothetical protein
VLGRTAEHNTAGIYVAGRRVTPLANLPIHMCPPACQALDSTVITMQQRLDAQPHATDWQDAVAAGDLAYSSSTCARGSSSSDGGSRSSSAAGQLPGGLLPASLQLAVMLQLLQGPGVVEHAASCCFASAATCSCRAGDDACCNHQQPCLTLDLQGQGACQAADRLCKMKLVDCQPSSPAVRAQAASASRCAAYVCWQAADTCMLQLQWL